MVAIKSLLVEARQYDIINGKRTHTKEQRALLRKKWQETHGNWLINPNSNIFTTELYGIKINISSHFIERFIERYPSVSKKDKWRFIKRIVSQINDIKFDDGCDMWDKYSHLRNNNPLLFSESKQVGIVVKFNKDRSIDLVTILPYTHNGAKRKFIVECVEIDI